MRLRGDSWAADLTPDQREELMADLTASRLTCREAAARAARWRGKPVREKAVEKWHATHRMPWLLDRAKEAAEAAMAAAPADLDEAARRAVGMQKMVAVYGDLSPKEIVAFERNELARRKVDLDASRLEVDRRKLELLEKKAAAADEAAGVLADDRLTPEERERRMKEVFGL